MKFITYLILIISVCSCNEDAKLNDNGANQNERKTKSVTDNSDIVGHWNMCAESGGGQMIQYNVCPTIIFKSDGSGSKINADGLSEPFSWTLKNRLLKINYSTTNENKTFPDTNYIAIFKKNAKGIELEIRQEKKEYSSYLGRER